MPDELDIIGNTVVNVGDGVQRIELKELARIVYFRPDTLPPGIQPELMATRHYVPREYPFAFTNGVQASWLEVDTETGFVRLSGIGWWRIAAPLSIRSSSTSRSGVGGAGARAALFEKCIYDERGQLTNANMADYLVPMSVKCRISMSAMWCRRRWRASWAPRAPARPAPRGGGGRRQCGQ